MVLRWFYFYGFLSFFFFFFGGGSNSFSWFVDYLKGSWPQKHSNQHKKCKGMDQLNLPWSVLNLLDTAGDWDLVIEDVEVGDEAVYECQVGHLKSRTRLVVNIPSTESVICKYLSYSPILTSALSRWSSYCPPSSLSPCQARRDCSHELPSRESSSCLIYLVQAGGHQGVQLHLHPHHHGNKHFWRFLLLPRQN